MLLVSLAALALTAGGTAEAQQVRVFPVGSLLSRGPNTDSMAMLPYAWSSSGSMFLDEDVEFTSSLEVEELMELCRMVVAPDVWDSGEAWMDVRAGARSGGYELLVTGPEPVLEEVQRFLNFLEETLVATERLEVRVYAGEVGPTEPLVQDQQAARERLGSLVQAGQLRLLRSGAVLLRDGQSHQIEAVDLEPLVLGWSLEIASGATAAQADRFVVGTGLTLFVRAAPTEGGTLLDLMLRESEHVAPPAVERLLTTSTINSKTSLTTQRTVGIVEQPRVAFASFAGSAVIPSGKALLLPMSLETATGSLQFLVDLRVTGELRPAHASFLLASRGDPEAPARLDLFRLGHWYTEGVLPARLVASTLGPDMYLDEDPDLVVSRYGENLGLDLLEGLLGGAILEFQEREDHALWTRGSQMWTLSSPNVADRIARISGAVAPPPASFEVSGRVVAGDREIGRFRLPLVSRRPVSLWSGVQSMALDGWETEVAQDVSTAHPRFRALLDGFAFRLEPAAAPDGSTALDVAVKLNLLREPPRMLDLETGDNRQLTKSRTQSVFVEDSVRMDPAGSASFVLGSDPSLHLEVRPRR